MDVIRGIWLMLIGMLPMVLSGQELSVQSQEVDTVYLDTWETLWAEISIERQIADSAFDIGDLSTASRHLIVMRELHQPYRDAMLDNTRRSGGKLFLPATFNQIEACRYSCARMTAVSEAIYWMDFLTEWQKRQELPPHPEHCACMRCSIQKARK